MIGYSCFYNKLSLYVSLISFVIFFLANCLRFCSDFVILLLSLIMKVQDFRTALKDDEVKSLFLDIFNDKIEQVVQTYIAGISDKIGEKFTKKMDEMNLTLVTLRAEIQRKDLALEKITSENQQLKSTIQALSGKLEDSEAYQRRENLIFSGLPIRDADRAAATSDTLAQSSQSITDKVVTFCNDVLGCKVASADISIAHPLPASNGSTNPSIIVRFVRRSVRDDVYSARMKLKNYKTTLNSKVYINEDLTASNRKILAALRLKVRNKTILGAWTQSGKVHAKDCRGNVKPIVTLSEAHDFA